MFAIEFNATVTDGTIELPAMYRDRVSGSVRVIILTEETASEPDMIERLLRDPLHISDFKPLRRDQLYERP